MAGGVFHIYARGNNGELIFIDDEDRQRYLAFLVEQVEAFGLRLLAYCLMDNHIHLLVMTPEPNLGRAMQRLQGRYAQSFNRRHGRSGHLFQGRYGAVRLVSDAQLWTVAAYILLNPVNAGMCKSASDYAWSSYRALTTGAAPQWLAVDDLTTLLAAVGGDDARARFVAFVDGAPPMARPRPKPRPRGARGRPATAAKPRWSPDRPRRRSRRRPPPL